jgi:hypothetical protein
MNHGGHAHRPSIPKHCSEGGEVVKKEEQKRESEVFSVEPYFWFQE